MIKNSIIKIIGILIILTMFFGCSNQIDNSQRGVQKQNNIHNGTIPDLPIEELSNAEIEALKITLEDEYKAEATYKKVLDLFGDVKPFSNIINAEKKHSESLIELFNKYELNVPENTWLKKIGDFESVQAACQAGVQAEIDNVALYDRLFEDIDNQDITLVFKSLRDASQNNHLPAFERCAN